MPVRSPTLTRLWANVAVASADACWIFAGTLDGCGYGSIGLSGTRRTDRVHRVVYRREVGDIADDMTIDHLCRNRACVNVRHMTPVPAAENIRRRNGWLNGKCGKGHALTPKNVYVNNKTGSSRCRRCHTNRQLDFERRQRAGL